MQNHKGNRSKKDIMSGVSATPTWTRKRANNTVEYGLEDGTRCIRLHDTDIIKFMPNGDTVLNSGGWQTRTTKDRINKYQPNGIFQHKNVWYLDCDGKTHAFQDGITITRNGKVKHAANMKRLDTHQKQIKAYVKGYCEALFNGDIPAPSGGDCWFCSLVDAQGMSWGETSNNKDHILSHMKEKYYVPSLVVNACKRFSISKAGWHTLSCYFSNADQMVVWQGVGNRQIKSSLTRYLRSQLGMAD